MEGQQVVEKKAAGECPVCGEMIIPMEPVEESEIISCSGCLSALVVNAIQSDCITLEMAPQEEEDWGQ